MDDSHVLLGHPCQFDVNLIYNGRDNSCKFEWSGRKIGMLHRSKMKTRPARVVEKDLVFVVSQSENEFIGNLETGMEVFAATVRMLGVQKEETT